MGRYSLKDGKLTLPEVSVKNLTVQTHSNDNKFATPYIKLYSPAKGEDAQYLYLGTGGTLFMGTTVPVGTSGAFANVGTAV